MTWLQLLMLWVGLSGLFGGLMGLRAYRREILDIFATPKPVYRPSNVVKMRRRR